jgi:plastocyanin
VLAAGVLAAAATFPAALVQGADTEVKIHNFAFAPQRTTVKAGTTVTWINEDDIPHTVTPSTKLFKSKPLDTEDKFSFTLHDTWHVRVLLLVAPSHDGSRRG